MTWHSRKMTLRMTLFCLIVTVIREIGTRSQREQYQSTENVKMSSGKKAFCDWLGLACFQLASVLAHRPPDTGSQPRASRGVSTSPGLRGLYRERDVPAHPMLTTRPRKSTARHFDALFFMMIKRTRHEMLGALEMPVADLVTFGQSRAKPTCCWLQLHIYCTETGWNQTSH